MKDCSFKALRDKIHGIKGIRGVREYCVISSSSAFMKLPVIFMTYISGICSLNLGWNTV
jgi:hypothetical protein